MNLRDAKRIDIISDTHGHLSDALLGALEGADLIIHAGDITSEADYHELATIAPLRAVLGNNDWYYDYGPEVQALAGFTFEGAPVRRGALPRGAALPRRRRGGLRPHASGARGAAGRRMAGEPRFAHVPPWRARGHDGPDARRRGQRPVRGDHRPVGVAGPGGAHGRSRGYRIRFDLRAGSGEPAFPFGAIGARACSCGGAVPAGGVHRRAAKSCGDRVVPVLSGGGRDPLRSRGATACPAGGRPRTSQGADPVLRRGPKTFSKKFLRTRSVSVYTSSRSSEAIRTAAWGVSSVWLERRPVTSEVAGSSPVLPAIAKNSLFGKPNRLFCYRGTCLALFAFRIDRSTVRGDSVSSDRISISSSRDDTDVVSLFFSLSHLVGGGIYGWEMPTGYVQEGRFASINLSCPARMPLSCRSLSNNYH